MMRQSEYKKRLDPELGRFTRQHIYGEGITDVFKSIGSKLFGKTVKSAAKKGAEKALTTAATKTGEYAGNDGLPKKIRKECGIINLDDITGPGTHWVCYRNIDGLYEYFDPFRLIMPNEVLKYFKTGPVKRIVYSMDEIQNRSTVLCGYWCLYYLFERQRGNSILNVIHNPHFDNDNSDFIQEYFGG